MRRLFERLVVVGAEGEPTRRRALRTELVAAAGPSTGAVPELTEVWAQARLLTLDRHPESREPTVEVAHEALLREWPRLRGWLDEDREGSWRSAISARMRRVGPSSITTRVPSTAGRDSTPRCSSPTAAAHALPTLEREFLDASRTARDRERQREVEQLERTARANRRLRASSQHSPSA